MSTIKFQVDGYLEGGFPIEEEDIETITELDYYDKLINLLKMVMRKKLIRISVLISTTFKQDLLIKDIIC